MKSRDQSDLKLLSFLHCLSCDELSFQEAGILAQSIVLWLQLYIYLVILIVQNVGFCQMYLLPSSSKTAVRGSLTRLLVALQGY